MTENRELSVDDYLAILRRRLKVILIPAMLAPIVGFAVSYGFSPKYTSQATVLVEDPKIPEGYVASVVTDDLSNRIATLEQRALSAERLRPLIENLKLAQGNAVEAKMDEIREPGNFSIQPVASITISPNATGPKRKTQGQVPGFVVAYTATNPHEAQALCSGLSDIMLQENLKDRASTARSTSDFLGRQVEEDKRKLDEHYSRLADFKKRFIGQLPGQEDSNLKMLMGLNSQLDASTQTLNRAQQDKTYAESMLAQQLAAWKSSQNASNPQTLEQQLSGLQAQLVTLQSRYTDDYPEVVKTKRDIAEVQRQLNAINDAPAPTTQVNDRGNLQEPPEIRQLRLQIHQLQNQISASTRDQQKIQEQQKILQGRVALSPAIEEQYQQLTRDNEILQKVYDDDLAKSRQSEKQTAMELEQQGEQMQILNPADLPGAPSFPNRMLFAAGGLGGGLAIGLGLTIWLEMRDKFVRTEQDVLAVLDLPVLTQVPWVGTQPGEKDEVAKKKQRSLREEKKETVEV
jgi:polysaccharide chain length determinant protein (PEP-CTERM system associated)